MSVDPSNRKAVIVKLAKGNVPELAHLVKNSKPRDDMMNYLMKILI